MVSQNIKFIVHVFETVIKDHLHIKTTFALSHGWSVNTDFIVLCYSLSNAEFIQWVDVKFTWLSRAQMGWSWNLDGGDFTQDIENKLDTNVLC